MGNNQSREIEEFKDQYQKQKDFKDPRYGDVTFYHAKHNPDNMVMVKDKWTNSLSESQEITGFIENRKNISHPNLCANRHYIQQQDNQWFNTFHKHTLAFDYEENNVEKEIDERNNFNHGDFNTTTKFSEPELWYLANAATNVDTTLAREGGSYHGDIQPSTMLLTPDGRTKTIDSALVNLDNPAYKRMLYDRSTKVALSPNLCKQMQETKVNPDYNPSKEDSWGLGMTMLCASTNTKLDDYYDWSVPEVRRQRVNESLDSVNGPYSRQMHGFIESCLEESDDVRPSMEDHEKFLRPYQSEINDMRLDFKDRRVEVKSTPPPPPVKEYVPPPPPKPEITNLLGGGDFFDNEEILPVQGIDFGDVINDGPGGFFDTTENIVIQDDAGNFFG